MKPFCQWSATDCLLQQLTWPSLLMENETMAKKYIIFWATTFNYINHILKSHEKSYDLLTQKIIHLFHALIES